MPRSTLRLAVLVPTLGLMLGLTPLALAQRAQLPASQAPKNQPVPPDRLAGLEEQIKKLQSKVDQLVGKSPYNFAYLDCNSKKYTEFRLAESHLVFFASCENIEPYLEGYKVVLKIGNPYSFNFSNVKGRLQHGKTTAEAVAQETDLSTTETLRGGAWQTITVIVSPSKPEDMRELWLELKAETVAPTR